MLCVLHLKLAAHLCQVIDNASIFCDSCFSTNGGRRTSAAIGRSSSSELGLSQSSVPQLCMKMEAAGYAILPPKDVEPLTKPPLDWSIDIC